MDNDDRRPRPTAAAALASPAQPQGAATHPSALSTSALVATHALPTTPTSCISTAFTAASNCTTADTIIDLEDTRRAISGHLNPSIPTLPLPEPTP